MLLHIIIGMNLRNNVKGKKPNTKEHVPYNNVFKVQDQAKVVCGDRGQDCGHRVGKGEVGIDQKKTQRNFQERGKCSLR